jgi:endonuclease/exonuclease/phosphatase family metal-dependent hydrolase
VILLVAAVGLALVLALSGWGRWGDRSPETRGEPGSGALSAAALRAAGRPFILMQLNVCLSGLAECYGEVTYPAMVRETVAKIRRVDPDAVTLNEGCRRDAARIAHRTGLHVRFSRVIYHGAKLPCVDPRGRGLFGDAVLTNASIEVSTSRAFEEQAGFERRRWLCVSTGRDLDVCTAHLNTGRSLTGMAANDAQCAELAGLLADRGANGGVVFGGDVNRLGSCAPGGAWTRTDRSADQAPGLQQAYGTRSALRFPRAQVLPARHTDHDVLLVRARLVPRSQR